MPTISDYARAAPFTIDEIVECANSLLRQRPRLQIAPRTVRFYVSQGWLASPTGVARSSRYSLEHLARVVGLRLLQDQGKNLEGAAQELNLQPDKIGFVDRLLAGSTPSIPAPRDTVLPMLMLDQQVQYKRNPEVLAETALFARKEKQATVVPSAVHVRRHSLAPGVVLEIGEDVDLGSVAKALRSFAEIIEMAT